MKAGATKSVVVAVQPSTSRAPARAQRRTRARPRRRRRRTCGEKLRRCYKACVSPSCALACLAVVLMLAATVLLVSVVSEGDAATGQVVAGVVCLSLAVFTAVAFVAVTLRRRSQQRMNLVKAQAVVHSQNAVCTICNRSTRSVCDQSHKWVTKQRLQALGKDARAKVKAALAESRAVPGFSRSVCPVGAGLCGAFVDATCGASNCPPALTCASFYPGSVCPVYRAPVPHALYRQGNSLRQSRQRNLSKTRVCVDLGVPARRSIARQNYSSGDARPSVRALGARREQ